MKKTRLLEIIKEEITLALNEKINVTVTNKKGDTDVMAYDTPADKAEVTRLKQDSNISSIKTTAGLKIKEDQLDEDLLNEIPYIGGERGEELFAAIKTAATNLKDRFPSATPDDISKIILSKKKRPELAPEVEDALIAQEEKFGGEEKYTPNLGGPQTLRAVEKALGTKSEKSTEPKEPKAPKAATEPKTSKEPKATAEPKKAEPAKAERGPSEKSLEKGSKLADKKDDLVKGLRAAQGEMKSLAAGLKDLQGKEREDLVAKLKAKTAEKNDIQKQIDKL
jgi:hypothetical protein